MSSSVIQQVFPPDVFGIVEKGIYRSNAFEAVNYSFIRSLSLKSVVILSPEAPTRVSHSKRIAIFVIL